MKLTSAQEAAYRRPCFVAEETLNPAFRRLLNHSERLFSVVLTANIGLE